MEGVRQMGTCLQAMGHEVAILTLDSPEEAWVIDHPMRVHALGPSRGSYRYNTRLTPWLLENAHRYDVVIVNGLWQHHGFGSWRALTRLKKPYYVYSHGMLDPWFKRAYPLKHFKKWLYWPWAEYRLLRDAAGVLFTSEDERLLARESFWLYRAQEHVVSYGTASPPMERERLRDVFFNAYPELRGKRLMLFLSRIHEKKGCDLLVQAFAKVAVTDPTLHLVVAGPDQTNLLPALRAQAEALGVADRISWPGMLQGGTKWGAFYTAEAFVLPSHQENFGIAVAEALGCGLPVLISNKINIWREIEAGGAGIVGDDTYVGTYQTLERWLALSPEARLQMGCDAKKLFEQRFTVQAMAESLLQVIRTTTSLSGKALPSTVGGAG